MVAGGEAALETSPPYGGVGGRQWQPHLMALPSLPRHRSEIRDATCTSTQAFSPLADSALGAGCLRKISQPPSVVQSAHYLYLLLL